jgi:hypothetical protein
VKSVGFRTIEQFAITDPLPAHFDGGRYLMLEVRCEPAQEPIRRGEPSRHDFMLDPLPAEAKNIGGEFSAYGREGLEKVFQGESVREIIKQGADWNGRAIQNFRITDDQGFRSHNVWAECIRNRALEHTLKD